MHWPHASQRHRVRRNDKIPRMIHQNHSRMICYLVSAIAMFLGCKNVESICERAWHIQRHVSPSYKAMLSIFIVKTLIADLHTFHPNHLPATPTHDFFGMNIFAEAWVSSFHPKNTFTLSSNHRRTAIAESSTFFDSKILRNAPKQNPGNALLWSNGVSIYSNEANQSTAPFEPKKQLDLRILLIDNHDSYTYNLYQYLSTMTTEPVTVVMNDAYSSWDDFMQHLSGDASSTASLHEYFDCLILSPGPGQPACPDDMGIVLETIRKNSDIPILGVCLGHQALGYVYGKDKIGKKSLTDDIYSDGTIGNNNQGAEVKLAPCGPVHGLMSSVFWLKDDDSIGSNSSGHHLTCQLFNGLPQNFDVVRYHSLVVDFSECRDNLVIEPIAWCNSFNSSATNEFVSQNETICMALRHKKYPHYGVQFHPESIGTGEVGYRLLWNFCDFADQYKARRRHQLGMPIKAPFRNTNIESSDPAIKLGESNNGIQPTYRVLIHKITGVEIGGKIKMPSPEVVFDELYRSRPNSFWLDSSTGGECFDNNDPNSQLPNGDTQVEGCPITSNSRFSIMGSDDGPLSRKIEYFGSEHCAERRGLSVISKRPDQNLRYKSEKRNDTDILSYLRERLVNASEFVDVVHLLDFATCYDGADDEITISALAEFDKDIISNEIPFDYRGGYIGYLGYEVRHDTQCRILEQEGVQGCVANDRENSGKTNPNVPTAAFLFADRSLVYDHKNGDWYAIGVTNLEEVDDITSKADYHKFNNTEYTIAWIRSVKNSLLSMASSKARLTKSTATSSAYNPQEKTNLTFIPNRSKETYQKDIARSHQEIRNGESYELCVTNQLEAEFEAPLPKSKNIHEVPVSIYKLLRKKNPAPFSAYMGFYPDRLLEPSISSSGAVSICCSSPERFLSVKKPQLRSDCFHTSTAKKFIVESKPIKGTASRYTGNEPIEIAKKIDSQIASDLKESVKDKAENLMIVDLLRNDLGRICEVGSVHVPKLMHIETYATVHQMVSTVRGTLDGDKKNAIDVIEACFPGGSMTGAPKQRTMEILEDIEQGVSRGPYSGCLGYISLNGCMDMNIIIRSAIVTPMDGDESTASRWKASVGCGGAITALSVSEDEYQEMLLKSRAVCDTISEWVEQVSEGNEGI
ncbi:hypothetical protein ACHAXS_012667 [Conticribra weissflogii]